MNQKLQEKVDQAKKVISDQCVNSRWQMCVPPQSDDSDIVLHDTLDALVAEIERLEVESTIVYNYTINFPAPPPDPQVAAFVKDFNFRYSVPKVSAEEAAEGMNQLAEMGHPSAEVMGMFRNQMEMPRE